MTTKINEKERVVLEVLADSYAPEEWGAYSFAPLSKKTSLDVKEVRRACRSLARKGLAQYERVLVDGDGVPAGAGYRATEEGAALICPCDVCGARATYEYNVEEDGSFTMNDDEKTRLVRECEVHYKHVRDQKLPV